MSKVAEAMETYEVYVFPGRSVDEAIKELEDDGYVVEPVEHHPYWSKLIVYGLYPLEKYTSVTTRLCDSETRLADNIYYW